MKTAMKPGDSPVLTVHDAVALSRVSRATINKMIAQKIVHSAKVGGRRLINRESLLRVLHDGTAGPITQRDDDVPMPPSVA
jgi:excisionase family DNA binding protein